jgi:hypothetical protein
MSPLPNALPDSSETPRPRLYTPGVSNHLGDRLLTFDNGTASSLELLKFKAALAHAPGFEDALRKRVDDLQKFRHPSIAPVRGVEWLNQGEGLALVSIHTAGRRLSEILKDAHGATFAMELVRQIAPALVALQQAGSGLAHGALTPDRIVVTREGRLVVVEHVLGAALEQLRYPAGRVREELGLAAPADADPVKFTPRLDVIQLGFVALSLLLGRGLDPTDYPGNIAMLLDEFTRTDPAGSARLRPWLERALQMGAQPFEDAQSALDAFNHLPSDSEVTSSTPVAVTPRPLAKPAPSPAEPVRAIKVDAPRASEPKHSGHKGLEPEIDESMHAHAPKQWHSGRGMKIVKWSAAALALLVVGEGLVIAGLFSRPATVVVNAPPPRAELLPTQPPAVITITPPVTTPAPTPEAPALVTPAPRPADTSASAATTKNDTASADKPVPAGPKFGGVKLASTIDLQVFESNNLLGSTAGPIAINEGTHALELVNDLLGFRTTKTINVKAGQMTAINVPVPDGRVSINAVPWADVVIDGTPAGQTPIANLSLKIGQHEVVFRHPQLGEQRQTITVKTDGITKVSAVLQK